MLTGLLRCLLWRRRVREARVWREAERRQAAERSQAIQRILDQAVDMPDRVRPGRA